MQFAVNIKDETIGLCANLFQTTRIFTYVPPPVSLATFDTVTAYHERVAIATATPVVVAEGGRDFAGPPLIPSEAEGWQGEPEAAGRSGPGPRAARGLASGRDHARQGGRRGLGEVFVSSRRGRVRPRFLLIFDISINYLLSNTYLTWYQNHLIKPQDILTSDISYNFVIYHFTLSQKC